MTPITTSLAVATAQLAAAGIDDPHREARILLAHALGIDRTALVRRLDGTLTAAEADRFRSLISRRAAREPAATIFGHREFWSLDFIVSKDTLIPRPDSELLIETALTLHPDRKLGRILDLGTGTGCLLLAALTEFPTAWGLGIDLSPAAARIAQMNAQNLGLSDRAAILVAEWTEALAGRFDLIVSNPPYIPLGDIAGLMPEVAAHEPHLALDGGPDGLDPYRTLFPRLERLLTPAGTALFEFGIGQADALASLARETGLRVLGQERDLAGLPRVLIVCRP
ncbi:peptide chain release factor N(5)-glutamine methyltransferase [Acidisoma cladoniae]|uniref:peptide chain release factor N(5)-glutamine methyltransferase n=1 Tax=Acidisoma cladoniae TaxID=3040935 RepID=UPI00254A1396|nr:peptide chain release factor N(5)-glutamine methyltransferase [Acidisoma sp. PAMC 29798]